MSAWTDITITIAAQAKRRTALSQARRETGARIRVMTDSIVSAEVRRAVFQTRNVLSE